MKMFHRFICPPGLLAGALLLGTPWGAPGAVAAEPKPPAPAGTQNPGLPIVTIAVRNPVISEGGKQVAVLTLTREGGRMDEPLIVHTRVTGSATEGRDYEYIPSSFVIIRKNRASVDVPITPFDDTIVEQAETVTMSLLPPAGPSSQYVIGAVASASVTIEDDDHDPVAAPSVLTARAVSSHQINLGWDDNATAGTGFEIERKTPASGWARIARVAANVTSYRDTVVPGTSYAYRVRATGAAAPSAYSREANAVAVVARHAAAWSASAATRLAGGWLEDRFAKNYKNLFLNVDPQTFAHVYEGVHPSWYAEPEFAGKYVDSCIALYRYLRDPAILARASTIVSGMIGHQRADGYSGTYGPGDEFDTFSVWNQTFTIRALVSYYNETHDAKALAAAQRCADYLIASFLRPGGPDMLQAINDGVQHSCILADMVRLYNVTNKPEYLDFAQYIVQRWNRSENLQLVANAADWTRAGSRKAAEMLICYQGLMALYDATSDTAYREAAKNYWDSIARTQIGVTGAGSLHERWNVVGNDPSFLTGATWLPTDRPHERAEICENCVAVTWMKLSTMLLLETGEGRYGDALEKTLYNHLLGSQAIDGCDFSYYQPQDGKKIHVNPPGKYSCCRYRGLNALAHLPEWVVLESAEGPIVNLYAEATSKVRKDGTDIEIVQHTDYPRHGRIHLDVNPSSPTEFRLRLRQPAWSRRATVQVNGAIVAATARDGFITLDRKWARGDTVELTLDMPVTVTRSKVKDEPRAAVNYGPLVLATDSRYGAAIDAVALALGSNGEIYLSEQPADPIAPIVRFETPGIIQGKLGRITLVDYASAGSIDKANDLFRIWLRY